MASASGWERGKILPLGGCEPGWRSMAQSPALCGGSWVDLVLLKASVRSWYSEGSCFLEVSDEPLTEVEVKTIPLAVF